MAAARKSNSEISRERSISGKRVTRASTARCFCTAPHPVLCVHRLAALCPGRISVFVGIEFVGTGHGHAYGSERVQDADAFAVFCEDLRQAFVAVRGFVQAGSA